MRRRLILIAAAALLNTPAFAQVLAGPGANGEAPTNAPQAVDGRAAATDPAAVSAAVAAAEGQNAETAAPAIVNATVGANASPLTLDTLEAGMDLKGADNVDLGKISRVVRSADGWITSVVVEVSEGSFRVIPPAGIYVHGRTAITPLSPSQVAEMPRSAE